MYISSAEYETLNKLINLYYDRKKAYEDIREAKRDLYDSQQNPSSFFDFVSFDKRQVEFAETQLEIVNREYSTVLSQISENYLVNLVDSTKREMDKLEEEEQRREDNLLDLRDDYEKESDGEKYRRKAKEKFEILKNGSFLFMALGIIYIVLHNFFDFFSYWTVVSNIIAGICSIAFLVLGIIFSHYYKEKNRRYQRVKSSRLEKLREISDEIGKPVSAELQELRTKYQIYKTFLDNKRGRFYPT